MNIVIRSDDEIRLRAELESRHDAESERIKRYLNMPDLSRTPGSPLYELVKRSSETPVLKGFDDINIPEIVPADMSFDLFNFPPNHTARSRSDTYYVDEKNILRTHDTVMWYYYLNHPAIKEKIKTGARLGVICYGKVYRKDEIDRHHMNVFHQMGGLYLTPDSQKMFDFDDLKNVLTQIAQGIFGPNVKCRFSADTFPYTDPSLEMEVKVNDKWIEVLGGGMPRKDVLSNFGVTGYNGWAYGFGLERLAIISMQLPDIRLLWSKDPRVTKQLKLGKKYVEVSRYPQIKRDISFVVGDDFIPNNYFDLIRDIGGDLVEQVELLDKYQDEKKFGRGRTSYTYGVVYRSPDRTLTTEEVERLQNKLYRETHVQFNAELR